MARRSRAAVSGSAILLATLYGAIPLSAASSTVGASARIISPVFVEASVPQSQLTLTVASLRNGYIRLADGSSHRFERQTELKVTFGSAPVQNNGPTATFFGTAVQASTRKILFDRRAATEARRGSLLVTVHNY